MLTAQTGNKQATN